MAFLFDPPPVFQAEAREQRSVLLPHGYQLAHARIPGTLFHVPTPSPMGASRLNWCRRAGNRTLTYRKVWRPVARGFSTCLRARSKSAKVEPIGNDLAHQSISSGQDCRNNGKPDALSARGYANLLSASLASFSASCAISNARRQEDLCRGGVWRFRLLPSTISTAFATARPLPPDPT